MRPLIRCGTLPASLLLLLSSSILQPVFGQEPADVASNELKIEHTKPVTCSRPTKEGDMISVHYRGTLQSTGAQFDASYNRGVPFSFKLGAHQVIPGWDQGLLDMCIGEGRKLIIPPSLGYGNRANGAIPAGSTLVFETELMAIKGVKADVPSSTTASLAISTTSAVSTSIPAETVTSGTLTGEKGFTIATANPIPETTAEASAEPTKGADSGPITIQIDKEGGKCQLLGPFALIVQGALGALALLSLVFKRWRERPRRPIKIWFFDVSKQVVGSILLHILNLFMSMISSGDFDAESTAQAIAQSAKDDEGHMPNPCSFYLLNLAIDTTIGIPVLIILLRVFYKLFLYTPMANPPESIKSGNYGQPPRVTWWLKQSLIYFICLFGMKLFVFFLFAALPWLAWVGDWALRWTEGNEALQIAFVMFIFPVAMNAIQYYIIDSFIKDQSDGQGDFERVPSEDSQEGDAGSHRRCRSEDSEEDEENKNLVNSNDTPAYDPHTDGGSSTSMDRSDETPK